MKLLHLKGTNYRSFAEFELDLNASGLFSVTGGNGAGKSSIFSSVEWALFGGKRGTGSERVRRQGTDGSCRVELEFEIAGRALRVVRIDGKDAWLTDVETGERLATGLQHTSEAVAVRLGLTQTMFRGTFYARQKEVQALSSGKSLSDRRDQLETLLGIEHLRRAADFADRDAREQKALVKRLAEEAPDLDELRAEVERCERVALATPAIAELEGREAELKEKLDTAVKTIAQVTRQISEHSTRELAATKATGEMERERTILNGLLQRRQVAKDAGAELAALTPVAARADEVSAREREMDTHRRDHERVEKLRGQERVALEELAEATDALSALGDAPSDGDPSRRFAPAQQELNDVGGELREAVDARQRADDVARQARELLARAHMAAETKRALGELETSEAHVDRSRERWHELRADTAGIEAQLAHDIKHRDALLGAGDNDAGVCPTCHRPLEGTLGDLVAEFEASIAEREDALKALNAEMDELLRLGKQHKPAAERAAQLRAQLESLGDVGDSALLEAAHEEAKTAATHAADHEHTLDSRYRTLSEQIPQLRAAAEQAVTAGRLRAEAQERKTRAQHQAAMYAEQLGEARSNGYDPAAHAELKLDLTSTQEAVRRCAVLREHADASQLIDGRIATQQPLVDELTQKANDLASAADEIKPEEHAHEKAVAEHHRLTAEREDVRRELDAARKQLSIESHAVNAARARLEDGRKMLRMLTRERRDQEFHASVAKALGDYREHASKRARPSLEREASDMLKQVTGQYPIIRLSDAYLPQIADGGEFHKIERFSGGEQDLAALCLRLALSRVLARQRGAEHGFVILDEVFGSQDVERRRRLLEQLGKLADAEFQQIFVISHTDDVIDHCRLHIKVTRKDGISVAEGPTTNP